MYIPHLKVALVSEFGGGAATLGIVGLSTLADPGGQFASHYYRVCHSTHLVLKSFGRLDRSKQAVPFCPNYQAI